MRARERFHVGQRVRMSQEGRQVKLSGWDIPGGAYGIVVGFGHGDDAVAVVRDGQVTRTKYHQSFWEPAIY